MSRESTTKSKNTPLYRCEQCGERLYMTLAGEILCFNCGSSIQDTTETSKENDRQASKEKSEMGGGKSVIAAPIVEYTTDLRMKENNSEKD